MTLQHKNNILTLQYNSSLGGIQIKDKAKKNHFLLALHTTYPLEMLLTSNNSLIRKLIYSLKRLKKSRVICIIKRYLQG